MAQHDATSIQDLDSKSHDPTGKYIRASFSTSRIETVDSLEF